MDVHVWIYFKRRASRGQLAMRTFISLNQPKIWQTLPNIVQKLKKSVTEDHFEKLAMDTGKND